MKLYRARSVQRRVKQNVCFNSTGSQWGTGGRRLGGWEEHSQPPKKATTRGKKVLEIILHYGNWGRLCVCYLEKSSNIITFMSSTELSSALNAVRAGTAGKGEANGKGRLDCKWIQFRGTTKLTISANQVAKIRKKPMFPFASLYIYSKVLHIIVHIC